MKALKALFNTLALTILLNLYGQSAYAADALNQLTELLSNIKTASGQFEQQLTDAQGQLIQASQGTFWVKKPGKFVWETQSPFPQSLISNGQTLWLYDPDLEQASISTLDQTAQQTPALLLSGDSEKIGQAYKVKVAGEGALKVFELTAKDAHATFPHMSASFQDGVLIRMSFEDQLKQQTQFVFDQVKLNPPLLDSRFEFTPPAGTDVIHND